MGTSTVNLVRGRSAACKRSSGNLELTALIFFAGLADGQLALHQYTQRCPACPGAIMPPQNFGMPLASPQVPMEGRPREVASYSQGTRGWRSKACAHAQPISAIGVPWACNRLVADSAQLDVLQRNQVNAGARSARYSGKRTRALQEVRSNSLAHATAGEGERGPVRRHRA
jgi:hypothetical protein